MRGIVVIVLAGVLPLAANELFASSYAGELAHFDGSACTEQASVSAGTQLENFWGTGPRDVYLVCDDGFIAHGQ